MSNATTIHVTREPRALLAAALAAPMVFMSSPAFAQATENWRFQAAVNLYLPDISGSTSFPSSGGGGGATIDAETILDNLKMAFMGTFEASRGPWGLFTDVLYMDIGDSRSGFRDISIGGLPIPADASASASYDLKGWGWTIAGTWHAVTDPAATLDVIAGVRLLDITQTLDWTITGNVASIPLPGRAGTSKVALRTGTASSASRGGWRSVPIASGTRRTTSMSARATRSSPGRPWSGSAMPSPGATSSRPGVTSTTR
jgi:hypothetical protein